MDSKIIPANVRMMAQNLIAPQNNNESFFTPQQLDILRDVVYNARRAGRNYFSYDDYPWKSTTVSPYSNKGMIKSTLTDPVYQVAHTIGGGRIHTSPQGNIHISDIYNFKNLTPEDASAGKMGGGYIALHKLMEKHSTPTSWDINLGNPKSWKGY